MSKKEKKIFSIDDAIRIHIGTTFIMIILYYVLTRQYEIIGFFVLDIIVFIILLFWYTTLRD